MSDPTENGHTEGDMSIAAQAKAWAEEGMADNLEELFPDGFMDGEAWTLGNIHKSGVPVEATVSLSRAEIPIRDGLPDPNKFRRVIVSTGGGKIEAIPTFEEGDIVSWKIRAHLKVTHIQQMGDPESVVAAEFEKLALANPKRAAEVAEQLVAFAKAVAR